MKIPQGANKITQATHAYFFVVFVTAFGEIFLEYSLKKSSKKIFKFFLKKIHTLLLRFMLKI
jgi:hypothetical protein